jgi:hypothetical protein
MDFYNVAERIDGRAFLRAATAAQAATAEAAKAAAATAEAILAGLGVLLA